MPVSTPAVLAALRAGRDAVAAGSPAYYRALPDTDEKTYETASRLLSRALYTYTAGGIESPRDVPQETRLAAYDLAIATASGEAQP